MGGELWEEKRSPRGVIYISQSHTPLGVSDLISKGLIWNTLCLGKAALVWYLSSLDFLFFLEDVHLRHDKGTGDSALGKSCNGKQDLMNI